MSDFELYVPNTLLPEAIIVDIDGTLAHRTNRGPYDTSKYADDEIDPIIRELVNFYIAAGTDVVIVTGRDEEFREVTWDWLVAKGISFHALYMRPSEPHLKQKRNDAVIKNEIFENRIKDRWNVLFVLDDRNRVVDMWRAKGIKCLQVEPGDF